MKDERLSIGRVSAMVQLPSSVLRYWETVFDLLKPEKTPGGTRKYTMQDVDVILKIKDLLYTRRYTIAGAKSELQPTKATELKDENLHLPDFIVKELESIIHDLASPEVNEPGRKRRAR